MDHGKTALIRAMTGINTDRLKEEQERGLTIDLGFAHLGLPSGREVGIIDVPGHERFLKNMLAGASGVDIALLVVAADEGVMPQTREHLEILRLLETRLGVVALTKCDMVEPEWLDVVEDDLKSYLSDTFLASARVIRVSAVTGRGIDELVAEIDRLTESAGQRRTEGPFRLPIDRVFTMTGFGTVVTGTLVSGTLKVGDPVIILPAGLESRVRGLQVHGQKRDTVLAGNRTAVNLVGVDVSEIRRGDVLLPPGYLEETKVLDAAVSVSRESPWPLKNRSRIRLHVGTAEVIGRAAVLGAGEIAPGESGFAQLKLEGPVVAARGDRFVLRFYSPMRVMGGGIVLDPAAVKHRRSEAALIERLERKLKGDPVDLVEDALAIKETGLSKQDIARATSLAERDVDQSLSELAETGRVFETGGRWMHRASFDAASARMESALEVYHSANPMKSGMPKEELRAAVGPRIDQKGFQALLAALSEAGRVIVTESTVRLPGHAPKLDAVQQKLADEIEAWFKSAGVNPPLPAEIEQKHGPKSRAIIALLAERGELVKMAPDMFFHRDAVQAAERALVEHLTKNGRTTVAEFRDVIGSSRKYVVPLLEYFDSKRVTRRAGDLRTLAKSPLH